MPRIIFLGAFILLLVGCERRQPQWQPEAAMDDQFFPALIIATVSTRPVAQEDEEAQQADPYLLGDRFGLLGVSISVPSPEAIIRVTIKENDIMDAAVWTGKLPLANHDYYIAPKLNYKFDNLRKITQPVALNVEFEVETDGKPLGSKTETLQLRSINDCPYGVANSEETIDDENFQSGSADMGWMLAAYVNENHPYLDKILKEALATKIVDVFDGYRANDPGQVMKQTFALWVALQKHESQYGSATEVSGGSSLVNSQTVRFLGQSDTNSRTNCVDGSILFASLLRKIGVNAFLVTMPGHMYVAFDLNNSEDENDRDYVGLETTLLGAAELDSSDSALPEHLAALANQLGENMRTSRAWKSFVAAVITANDDLDKHREKFDAGDPEYQVVDITKARKEGILPISFEAMPR